MVAKIVLIGAGSASFGLSSVCDLFAEREALWGSTVALVDINPQALASMVRVAQRMNAQAGYPFKIEAATDRREVLPGAGFVIISIAVERNKRWRLDWEIPLKHGVKHVLGENGGPGGLFHAMRNIPPVLEICRDIEALCPEALVLNFTNPEGRICLAATRYTRLQFVGLCHGIGMAQSVVSRALHLPVEEIDPKAAGLNHFTWLLELRRLSTGEDLYPAFRKAMAERVEELEAQVGWGLRLSARLMDTYGYWPSPSDDHVGEYLSYAWELCGLDGYDFEAAERGAANTYEDVRAYAAEERPVDELLDYRSGERAVAIITGMVHNTHQYELAVNVPNAGLIANLPEWAVVEVPAVIDASGVHGLRIGPLPAPIAAMCHNQVSVIDRMVEAAVHGDRNAALQALLLDPVISSISQAEAIFDELMAAHRDLLPQFGKG